MASIIIIYKNNRMAHHLHHQVIYQKEEEHTPICCFSFFRQPIQQQNHQNNHKLRVHSEPKEPKQKKINLLIGRRGFSQTKDSYCTPSTASKEKIGRQRSQQNTGEMRKALSTFASKLSTEKSSLKNSKVTFNRDLRIERPVVQNQKYLSISTGHSLKPPVNQSLPQKTEEMTDIPFLSEISIVEEQFISHQSASFNAFNFISNLQSVESKMSQQTGNARKVYDGLSSFAIRLQDEKSNKTPLERIKERKKIEKVRDVRKKLIL